MVIIAERIRMTNNQQQLNHLLELAEKITKLFSHILEIKQDIHKQTKAFMELLKAIQDEDVLSSSEKLHILKCITGEESNGKSKTTTTR